MDWDRHEPAPRYTRSPGVPTQSRHPFRRPEVLMLTAATSEAVRLMADLVRRIDAELAESAVRNAESGVRAHQQRWVEEVRTLSDLQALEARPARALTTAN
jgi:hypothetical protein